MGGWMHKAIIILLMLTEIQQKVYTKYFSYVRDFFLISTVLQGKQISSLFIPLSTTYN